MRPASVTPTMRIWAPCCAQDIKAGEELTFDYNFERYGDRPMRCYCQSKTCRKFVGGTQDTYDESMLVGVGGAGGEWCGCTMGDECVGESVSEV